MLVPIEKLEPGMVVAGAVMNSNKVVLLNEGAILTSDYIRTLKMWGIKSLSVVGDAGASPLHNTALQIPEDILATAENYVNQRLKYVAPESPAFNLIRALAIRRRALSLLHQRKPEFVPANES